MRRLFCQIPFASGNPDFERMLQHKKKIIVFNKTDVADPRSFGPLRRYFEARGQPVMLMAGDPYRPRTNKRTISGPNSDTVRSGVNRAQMRALHNLIAETLGPRRFQSVPPVVLVVGLPNTGKSTLINQFRLFGKLGTSANAAKKLDDPTREVTSKMQAGGAARTGPQPGVTRSISGFLVSASALSQTNGSKGTAATATDKLFLLDSPGIMLPYIASDREGVALGLKLGVIAALKEVIIGEEVLARFALWSLNRAHEFEYVRALDMAGPTTDLPTLLWAVWQKHYAASSGASGARGGKGSASGLFRQFSQRARQRRKWAEEHGDEAEEEEGEEEEEQRGERARQQYRNEADEDAHQVTLPQVAPLRFELPGLSRAAAAANPGAATYDAAAIAAAPSSAAPPPSIESREPLSVAELSSDEAALCTQWFLKRFRRGELGKITLDDIPRTERTPRADAAPSTH